VRAQAIAVDLTMPILVVDDYSTMIRITHYIVKPFNAQTLKNKIDAVFSEVPTPAA
jgi:hypothetical protein